MVDDASLPPLPKPDARGNYPALPYARASLARNIIRRRQDAGLTQVELARRAGIRPETLNRLEQGRHTPTIATVDKVDRVLREAQQAG
jgi:predicted transcriptional regulator